MRNNQFGEIKRCTKHNLLHEIIFIHGKVIHGIDMLNTGDIG